MHTRAAAVALALLLTAANGAPAQAAGATVVTEFLTYCTEAIATSDPTGPSLPNGVQANETGAILAKDGVDHFSMRRDNRGDWVCEVGEEQVKSLGRIVEDYLRDVDTVDKYRSTFGDNLYVAATICVGPNAVALIMNGPLTHELNMGTAVFSGGKVNPGCGG